MTTPTPKRRPLNLSPLQLRDIALRFTLAAPRMEVGWSAAIEEKRHSGWPTRTPDDDRKPRRADINLDDDEQLPPPDTGDITGEEALRMDRLTEDIMELQDHRHELENILKRMEKITDRYVPPFEPSVPCCSVNSCTEDVESRQGAGGVKLYVGMEEIAGLWVVKPGARAQCRKHRARWERGAA